MFIISVTVKTCNAVDNETPFISLNENKGITDLLAYNQLFSKIDRHEASFNL